MTKPLGLQHQRTTVSHKSPTKIHGNRLTKASCISLKSYCKKDTTPHFCVSDVEKSKYVHTLLLQNLPLIVQAVSAYTHKKATYSIS